MKIIKGMILTVIAGLLFYTWFFTGNRLMLVLFLIIFIILLEFDE